MLEMVLSGAFFYLTLAIIPIGMILFYLKYKSGLYSNERKIIKSFLFLYPLSLIGLYVGYLVSMFYIIPFFVDYNNSFGLSNYVMLINIVKLVLTTMLTFSLIIQIPTLFVLLKKNGVLNSGAMKNYRIHWLIISFVVGATLSPPDGISMIIFGIPIYLGYELSIWI